MTIVEVNGQELEFPDDMGQEQIKSVLRQKFPQPSQQSPRPQTPFEGVNSAMTGQMDAVYGYGQIAPRILEQVTSLGGYAPNPLSEAYGRNAKSMDEAVKQREQNYNAPQGIDWGRMAGNVINPANLVGGGTTTAGKVGYGAAMGMAQPTTNTDNFVGEKTLQAGIGGAVPFAGAAMGRVLNPQTKESVKTLLNQGVKLTAGEMAGGGLKKFEDALTSIPVAGQIIKGAQNKGIESLNTTAINKSLEPIGKALPKNIPYGREAIQYAEETLGKVYDNLLPKLTGLVDNQFSQDLGNVKNMVAQDYVMNDATKAKFNKIVSELVENRISQSGGITGQAIKEIESRLTDLTKTFGKSLDPSESQLADSLSEVQDTIRSMLERANPQYAKELKSVNTGWANFKRVQKAAAGVGTEEGVFNPSQLQSAVKAADRSKDKGAFARGSALMQDLSEPAKSIMSPKIANSGTTDRALASALLYGVGGGSAYGATTDSSFAPYLAPVAAATLMYSPAGRRMAQAILTERPELARKSGTGLNKYAQYLSGAVTNQGTR